MSCYEWEHGEIVIPKTQWPAFKKALRQACRNAIEEDILLAQKAIDAVRLANKGKRDVDWRSLLDNELRSERPGDRYSTRQYPLKIIDAWDIIHQMVRVEMTEAGSARNVLRTRVLKKDFPRITSKTDWIGSDGANVALKDNTRTVVWTVSENNHACERARASFLGVTLFRLLDRIKWGRGSGGYIVGNNEYHRDNNDLGGGANVLKDAFGPLGFRAHKSCAGALEGL